MKRNVHHFLILFFVLLSPPKTWADTVNQYIQVQCLEDLNALKIDIFGANGEIARNRSRENHERLWENHGIREIYTMVDFIRLKNEDGIPSEDYRDTKIVIKDSIQASCTLIEELENGKRESRTYNIHIEPFLFNANPTDIAVAL